VRLTCGKMRLDVENGNVGINSGISKFELLRILYIYVPLHVPIYISVREERKVSKFDHKFVRKVLNCGRAGKSN
jgi:hypothetical protein